MALPLRSISNILANSACASGDIGSAFACSDARGLETSSISPVLGLSSSLAICFSVNNFPCPAFSCSAYRCFSAAISAASLATSDRGLAVSAEARMGALFTPGIFVCRPSPRCFACRASISARCASAAVIAATFFFEAVPSFFQSSRTSRTFSIFVRSYPVISPVTGSLISFGVRSPASRIASRRFLPVRPHSFRVSLVRICVCGSFSHACLACCSALDLSTSARLAVSCCCCSHVWFVTCRCCSACSSATFASSATRVSLD